MKKFLLTCLLSLASVVGVSAQTKHFPALESDNLFTGKDSFQQAVTMGPVNFSSLPAVSGGQVVFCLDCQVTSPCVGGGTGSLATSNGSTWSCGGGGTVTNITIDAVKDCAVVSDHVSDAFPSLKACVIAHPGAHIQLPKLNQAVGCDYILSDTIFLLGQGQWIDGVGSGAGNGYNGNSFVNVCPNLGVTAFTSIGESSAGGRLSNFAITGAEPWTRTDATTYKLPFAFGYPGVPWVTANTTAGSGTVTVNGTNEAWNSQTDLQTVRILGGGATQGTITISTTANNYTATCACTLSMIGQTVAIPGALGGSVLYAHIVALTGSTGYIGYVSGNAKLDNKPTSTVSGVTGTLSYDYYGTVSSHASASSATVTPVVTTAVVNSVITVGSEADGFRSATVGGRIDHMTIRSMGRHGANVSNTFYPTGVGSASLISDEVHVDSNLFTANRGDGVYCQGGDCNVNKYSLSTMNGNQLWAIDDAGFLFNTIDTVNTASNHVPLVTTSGLFTNLTATWFGGSTTAAVAPPVTATDATCTDGSATVTTTSSGKFKTGHADATNGQIIKLTNCGVGGNTDLTTFITGYTTANSITVNDAPSCGGSCPSSGTATFMVYPTVTTTSGNTFDATHVGHMVLLSGAGPVGQQLVTTMAIFYSTTKMGVNAAPTNPSSAQVRSITFGTGDNVQYQNWQKAWDFTTGGTTATSTTLTTTAANELFNAVMCNAVANLRQVFTIKGAGVGGLDLSTSCTAFINSHQVTMSVPASVTIADVAEVQIEQDGGPYTFRHGACINCYEENDQAGNGSKFGSDVISTPSVRNPPAVTGNNTYSPVGTQIPGNVLCSWSDFGCTIKFQAGRSVREQIDLAWIDTNDMTTQLAKISMTTNGVYQQYLGGNLVFNFAPNDARYLYSDPQVTGTGTAFAWRADSTQANRMTMAANGDLSINCNSTGANCTKFTSTNTALRTINWPDATGKPLITGNGNSPLQIKRIAGCTTAASLAATCTTVVTWVTAFADTNYTANCTGELITSGIPLNGGITAKSTTSVTFQTVSATATATKYTSIACSASHD